LRLLGPRNLVSFLSSYFYATSEGISAKNISRNETPRTQPAGSARYGDATHDNVPLSEFYVFHMLNDVPFLFSRTRYAIYDEMFPIDFAGVPEVFCAAALLDSEFRRACDRVECEVSQRDRELHRDVYCAGSPMSYELTDDLPFLEFKIFGRFTDERAKMFGFSRSRAVTELREKLEKLPEAALHNEPKNVPKPT
jgi:hypothetical protein